MYSLSDAVSVATDVPAQNCSAFTGGIRLNALADVVLSLLGCRFGGEDVVAIVADAATVCAETPEGANVAAVSSARALTAATTR